MESDDASTEKGKRGMDKFYIDADGRIQAPKGVGRPITKSTKKSVLKQVLSNPNTWPELGVDEVEFEWVAQTGQYYVLMSNKMVDNGVIVVRWEDPDVHGRNTYAFLPDWADSKTVLEVLAGIVF